MRDLLNDKETLIILDEIVSGKAVSVNFSDLSRILDKHRNTIKNKVENIFNHKIVNRPVFRARWLVPKFMEFFRLNLS
jgi:hypothetical protein